MSKLLLFVVGSEKINGNEYLIAEPIDSETGISTGESEFEGELFVIHNEGRRPLGHCQVLMTLFEDFGLRWKVECESLPDSPYILSSDPELEISFDEQVKWNPSELICHRLSSSNWTAYPVVIGERNALICSNNSAELGFNRLIVFNGNGILLGKMTFRDVDDPDEIIGHVEFSASPLGVRSKNTVESKNTSELKSDDQGS